MSAVDCQIQEAFVSQINYLWDEIKKFKPIVRSEIKNLLSKLENELAPKWLSPGLNGLQILVKTNF